MRFDRDDWDWALGELLHLFKRANECGIYPHELDPDLFYEAWTILNMQNFEVRKYWHDVLIKSLRLPYPISPGTLKKRYAYVLPH
jgi:hypothetical protein